MIQYFEDPNNVRRLMEAVKKWIAFETCRLMALFGDLARDVDVTV